MLDIIAATYPRMVKALRQGGMRRADAAGLILAARYGERATAWTVTDCAKARHAIRAAFLNRGARLRLHVGG